jgi:glycosyltransferase involved in cell wall biosynthesis
VSIGALIPSKGHDLLIQAFERIALREPDLKLYILGEGPARSSLEDLVGRMNLQDRIQLIGKRPNDELLYWFSAADISCLTSEREGWPNVITESLACGTPVVGTRVGGIPEILESEDFGVLVDQTVESVANGLELALSKEWDRAAISQRTRARTWDHVALEVQEVLARQHECNPDGSSRVT